MLVAALSLFAAVAHADNFAVLVAGSNGFYNYRHQADVCHAYQILTRNGIDPDNIITMSYDDIASSSDNPFPGKLYNKPTAQGIPGVDVYEGCKIDYSGLDVTPENFLAIITGDEETATGKVLKSGSKDHVFINFVDHGAVGLIAFPDGELYADELNKALLEMESKNMYKELVFYLEACESGSMFQKKLPDNIKIFATTAANSHESSWGTYCPPNDQVNGYSLNTCLGDLYSVNWMEDADRGVASETLTQQFNTVKNETKQSHVEEFGERDMGNDKADSFWGANKTIPDFRALERDLQVPELKTMSSVDSRDIALTTFYSQYLNSGNDLEKRREYARKLMGEIELRQWSDDIFYKIGTQVMKVNNGVPSEALEGHREPTQFECIRSAVNDFKKTCGQISDYALKHVRILVNLCEITNSPQTISNSIHQICSE
ncbi:hypothetical protein AAMO2058_001630600 [Amorphochlora amoebiformis]